MACPGPGFVSKEKAQHLWLSLKNDKLASPRGHVFHNRCSMNERLSYNELVFNNK